MKMPEISVIVPVYKAEKYIEKCINSILIQSFEDFELILVDDGSPDNCGTICDKLSGNDNRIRVFHQKNQGVSVARNKGLDEARGDYVFFCDADDEIPDDTFRSLYEAIQSGVEFTTGYFKYVESDIRRNFRSVRMHNQIFRIDVREDFSTKFTQAWKCVNFMSCDGKLFRKDIIDRFHIRFDHSLVVFEDFDFVLNYLDRISSFTVVDKYVYSVFSEKTDAPHFLNRSRLDYVDDYIRGDEKLKNFLQKHGIAYEECYWRTIRANLQIAYDALWAMPEDTKEQRNKKYDRISTVLKMPQFQYKNEYEESNYSRLEYHLRKRANARILAQYYKISKWLRKKLL